MPIDEAHGVRATLLIGHFRRFLCDARRKSARIGIIEQSAPFSDRYITSSSPTLLRCRPRGAETSSPPPWSLGAANAKNASLTLCYARLRGSPARVDPHPPPGPLRAAQLRVYGSRSRAAAAHPLPAPSCPPPEPLCAIGITIVNSYVFVRKFGFVVSLSY